MTAPYRPSGIYSAQWLPIDSAGRLDRAGLATHLAFEKAAGINGVLGLGSTGEFPHFSPDERKVALAAVAELAAPLPVIANITDLRPKVAIELGRFAKSLGLPISTDMPEEVLQLLSLYPQPVRSVPTVEYLPTPPRPPTRSVQ